MYTKSVYHKLLNIILQCVQSYTDVHLYQKFKAEEATERIPVIIVEDFIQR